MKKLLSLLGSIGLVASTGVTSVVSCGDKEDKLVTDLTTAINAVLKDADGNAIKFDSADAEVAAIKGITSKDDVIGYNATEPGATAENQILISDVKLNDDKTKVEVSYKESAKGDTDGTFKWGDVSKTPLEFDVTVKDNTNSDFVVKNGETVVSNNQEISLAAAGSVTLSLNEVPTDLTAKSNVTDSKLQIVVDKTAKTVKITLKDGFASSENVTISATNYNNFVVKISLATPVKKDFVVKDGSNTVTAGQEIKLDAAGSVTLKLSEAADGLAAISDSASSKLTIAVSEDKTSVTITLNEGFESSENVTISATNYNNFVVKISLNK